MQQCLNRASSLGLCGSRRFMRLLHLRRPFRAVLIRTKQLVKRHHRRAIIAVEVSVVKVVYQGASPRLIEAVMPTDPKPTNSQSQSVTTSHFHPCDQVVVDLRLRL